MHLTTLPGRGLSMYASYIWLGKWAAQGDCIVRRGVHVAYMPHKSS